MHGFEAGLGEGVAAAQHAGEEDAGGEAKAALYMKEAARTLRCERGLYGPYPFDGYAVVEIPSTETGSLGGSSEQGMNLFPVGVLPDDEFPLLLLGHEIGHSGWGNLVGSDDGPILDEGLAQMKAIAEAAPRT